MNTKLKVILGSTRDGRVGLKVANWVIEQLTEIPNAEAELLDLKELNLPFLTDSVHPMMRGASYPDSLVQAWSNKISEADAFLILTPEYNHSFPGVLKNAIDLLYSEWSGKPVGFVGYSGVSSSAVRAVSQLIPVVMNLGMIPVPPSTQIGNLMKQAENERLDLDEFAQHFHKTANAVVGIAQKLKTSQAPTKLKQGVR
ncbi:MAG: NADPH-dependent FMN reductase [Candidatus Saccharimonadia bacterium]